MTYEEIKSAYEQTVQEEGLKLAAIKKQIFSIGTLRLGVFLATAFGVYWVWNDLALAGLIVLIGICAFLALAKYHDGLFRRKQYLELKVTNAENELKALDYDFSAFDSGTEYTSAEHSYANDLDLFGERSLFQSINRSTTALGKEYLAQTFINPLAEKDKIVERQQAIEELAKDQQFVDHFRALGQMNDKGNNSTLTFGNVSNKPLSKSVWALTPFLYPILLVLIIVLVSMDILSSNYFIVYWMLMIPIALIPTKQINQKLDSLTKKQDIIESYTQLLQVIENQKFDSKYLKDIQNNVCKPQSAFESIKKLNKEVHNAGISLTFIGVLFFNPFMSWNVVYALRIEKWIKQHATDFERWTDAIGRLDSLLSLARFAYNHPDYTFPNVSDKFVYEAKSMGHPLINRQVCVCNDIDILQRPFFMVVTGANMAGKSTYLRTVGINLILACIGSPVCASAMTFYPFQLVTNLRTSDSLNDNESYFFAELKRLKMIIDRLESGEELFIILDEILKGTNSEDKQKGSIALMKQLVEMKGNGIIATHDLELGHLEEEFPNAVRNFRFEADITNNELSFSYKMQPGVARNMNACFLMKKMGIAGLD